MSEQLPSDAAVSEFEDWTTKLRDLRRTSDLHEVERISQMSKIRSLCLNLAEAAKREEIMEAQVTRALMHGATGGNGAGP